MNETVLLSVIGLLVIVIIVPGFYVSYRQLSGIQDDRRRIDELEKARIEDRAELVRMHTELARVGLRLEMWMNYARQLAAIMDEAGLHVPLSPDEIAEQASQAFRHINPEDEGYNTAALLRRMSRAFNLDELHSLAFQMGIETGDLGGETFEARAISLITNVRRRGRLAELVALCRQLRPEAKF
jgi:hypothetical protein